MLPDFIFIKNNDFYVYEGSLNNHSNSSVEEKEEEEVKVDDDEYKNFAGK